MKTDYLEVVDTVDREVTKLKAVAILIDMTPPELSWSNGAASIITDCAEEIGRVVNNYYKEISGTSKNDSDD